jgi:quercetin dioxygenase-like cupin family protein
MKREESLIQTDTVRVRVMELLPGDATPWHFHREVTDHMVDLTGLIVVHIKQPTAMLDLYNRGNAVKFRLTGYIR